MVFVTASAQKSCSKWTLYMAKLSTSPITPLAPLCHGQPYIRPKISIQQKHSSNHDISLTLQQSLNRKLRTKNMLYSHNHRRIHRTISILTVIPEDTTTSSHIFMGNTSSPELSIDSDGLLDLLNVLVKLKSWSPAQV